MNTRSNVLLDLYQGQAQRPRMQTDNPLMMLAQAQAEPDVDPMTGIPNRDIMAEEMARARRSPLVMQPGQLSRPQPAPAPQFTPEQLQALPPSVRDAYERTWGSGY